MGHPRKVERLVICATMVIGDGCQCSVCQVKRKPGECSARGAIHCYRCWRLLRIMQWSVGLQAIERSKTVRRETLPVKCKEYMAAARPQHHNCINVYPPPTPTPFKKNRSIILIFSFSQQHGGQSGATARASTAVSSVHG